MRNTVLLLLILVHSGISGQTRHRKHEPKQLTRQEYIDLYAPFAVQEMLVSGVPASITLAQGLLESGDGNSLLAQKANNHFGIKCHGMWEGQKFYMDDDKKHECFRVYSSVLDSYHDHSEFLATKDRYASLFKLKVTNYKGWARGLKQAGYATNPKYPALLIKLIEENSLARYDKMKKPPKGKLKLPKEEEHGREAASGHQENEQQATVAGQRQQYLRNNIRYIRAVEGDTYKKLESLLQMRKWQLVKYNDRKGDVEPVEGEIIYLQPKRSKNAKAGYHFVAEGETLHWISQEYGVKLKKLHQYNDLNAEEEPAIGQKVWLRKKNRHDP